MLHLHQLQGKLQWGCWGVLGVKEEWARVSQRELSLRKADKGRNGNMCLVVASRWRWQKWRLMIFWMWMLVGWLLRIRGTLSLLQEGREGVRAEVQEMDRTRLRALLTTVLGNRQLRKKVDISEAPLS
eukprot:g14300.t1